MKSIFDDIPIIQEPFVKKSLEYESIGYLPYQKKAEIIKIENGIQLNRQTVYYHESKYSEHYITQKEEKLQKLLKDMNIKPSGIYSYDEEYLHENGEKCVRLAIIDAVTNLIINDQVIYQEDFDKEFMEIFLKYSLEGLPKKNTRYRRTSSISSNHRKNMHRPPTMHIPYNQKPTHTII